MVSKKQSAKNAKTGKAGQQDDSQVVTVVSPTANKTFYAEIIYKSGTVQNLSIVAESTNSFDLMLKAFLQADRFPNQPTGQIHNLASRGQILVVWGDVSSFRTWIE